MKQLLKEIYIENKGIIQFPILSNGLGWKSTEHNNLSVIESGTDGVLLSKMIEAIDKAKEFICLQSFLIQDTELIDSLLRATERKVKVFVLSSAEARLKDRIEEETDFIKENYIKLLENKLKNHFIHRTAENFHAKYLLIDPKTHPKGFICTNNFTMNGFVKNPELAVELDKTQCEELFKIFVYHFWEHATDEQTATKEFNKIKPATKFSLPKLDSILLTSPNDQYNTLNNALFNAVTKAKKSISFSTFLLDNNEGILNAIIVRAKQGFEVKLFCRPGERQFNEQLKTLLEAGVQIYFHPLLHAKSILIDKKEGYIFTSNLVEKGLKTGLEVGLKLSDNQTNDLLQIHENWEQDFPYRAIKSTSVNNLKAVTVFRDGKLTKTILNDDFKEQKQSIKKVEDLFTFFSKEFEIKDNTIKSLTVKLVAEIDVLPNTIQTNGNDLYEVVEIVESNQKIKVVVLTANFTSNDLHKLNDFRGYRIYFGK